jgi:hypothetical protein
LTPSEASFFQDAFREGDPPVELGNDVVVGSKLVIKYGAGYQHPSHMRKRLQKEVERTAPSFRAGEPPRVREAVGQKAAHRGPTTTADTYRDDPLYPRLTRAVATILAKGRVVTPVDVLICMDLLAPEKLEDWRRGRVPYLERVIHSNLTRTARLLRILRFHAHDLKLVPSVTAYMRWGRGSKRRLRFTKTGDPKLEEAYARHFVWPGKGPFHPPANKETCG